ncbi:hypothetical protein Tco_0994473, partial [Tanacetum coccineum]
MFRDTLKLPVETQDNLFIALVTIRTTELFMQTVGYQGVLDKASAFFTKFLAQPWQTMFKGMLLFQGMRIPDAFLIDEIRATDVYKKYETVFIRSQPLHKTALAAEAQENVAKLQEKLVEEEIEKMDRAESYKRKPRSDDDDEIDAMLSPTTATTSKSKSKRGFTSNKTKILLGSIAGMCKRRGRKPQISNYPELWEILRKQKFDEKSKVESKIEKAKSKDEKQVMYLVQIVKFCDATLEKVLKEVGSGVGVDTAYP